MGKLLKLPKGEWAKLHELKRGEELRRKLGDPPAPVFKGVRELILHKCQRDKETQLRAIFEKQPFGELERLVTRKILDVIKKVAKEELENENWLRLVARLSDRSYEEMRVLVLEFLDTDVFNVSIENCVTFLEPLIESWDIDLATFSMEITLNKRVVAAHVKKFEFFEKERNLPLDDEPRLQQFLRDASLSCGATKKEIEFLKRLKFKERRPVALYYYRELQNLRDPLHFR